MLCNPHHNMVLSPVRRFDPTYGLIEFLWYMSKSDKVDMLLPYAPSYSRFAEDDDRVHGAYGHRIGFNTSVDQLSEVIKQLKQHKDTRQAVITLWRPDDILGVHQYKDIPCTLTWHFLVRNGMLHMHCNMRSNDAWLGYPNDVFANTMVMRYVATALGLDLGTYHHYASSMHVYENRYPEACDIVESEYFITESNTDWQIGHEEVRDLLRFEASCRMLGSPPQIDEANTWSDWKLLIARKWRDDIDYQYFTDQMIRKAVDLHDNR